MMLHDKHLFGGRGAGIFFIASVFLLLINSCVTQKDVDNNRDKTETTKAFDEALVGDYKLTPNNELYIQINSLDDDANNIFSGTGTIN